MLKRNQLALSISAAVLSSGLMAPLATAQSDQALEEVTVTGIRGSLQDALSTKRDSYAIVDAISAEDIGKFPDKNVAESLQRVPGVTIQRQFGEGAAVSIRGAGNDLTLTTLNGQNVASTGWFVLEPAKRSFNYELLPSELVGDIEVYKSSQADLAEGGVGGTVVINTRKPLDLDSMTLHGSVEASSQSDSDSTDPQFSGLASWKNDAENFGVLVSAVSQERQLQRQGNEAFWEWGAGPVAFEQERKRSAINATFQYQPTENLDIVFNAIDMQMEADNTNYALWLTQGNCGWCGVDVDPADQINGTTARGPLNVAYLQARPREATMNSDVFDLSVDYAGEGYELSFQAGQTSSTGGTDFEMVADDGSGGTPIPGGTYDFFGGGQSWDLNGFDLGSYDPGSVVMGTGANFNATPKTDEETYFQADLEFEVEFGLINAIKTGIKTADHNTTSRRFEFLQADGFDPRISTAEVLDGTIESGAGSYDIPKLDADALKAWAKASIVGKVEDLGSYSEIDETNNALYAMATFDGERVRGNFGVRYISTEASSIYYLDEQRGSTSADYSEVLPSFNLAYDLSDDLILRTSAAKVIARPQYVDMYVNPNVLGADDEIDNNQFWVIGNVGLEPFTANQVDLGLEWYFAEGSLLSAAVFYKDVSNFVTISEYQASASEIPFDLPASEQGFGWTVQEKDNGESADITGIELGYQQDFGNGFGAIANYTWTDTSTARDTFTDGNPFLSDSSENVYNLTGYYENDMFSARVAYNWRSEYMIRESGAYGNRLHDDFGSLDLSAVWHATDSVDVKLDVNNLLAEESVQLGNNVEPTPGSGFTAGFPLYEYETARRVNLGVSAKF
ncbi:TonB-dependent receptor [Microbulbifer flavimaris]|uniref:TonB-dependent receptor n=1 Tax=Microbulbifer flavimaris TaxID=1781068 RepID=A0ABX4HZ68_9GAMM|nr:MULTISPECIES: TonB-dependent receptor [Microbulbifer]KUJ83294.1 ligand-gated channel protein [Microbulbifer sp. ZGT114]PCO05445.1 TonB-dependent receptor [Microbulbifer flavimaris]